MAEVVYPVFGSRSVLGGAPAATVNVALALMNRRANAIVDLWRSYAEVRQPADLMTAQFNYWSRLLDDYQEAITQGMASLEGASAGPPKMLPRAAVRSA